VCEPEDEVPAGGAPSVDGQELTLTKSKLASAEKKLNFADPELNKVAKLSIAANHSDYDEKEDTLTVKNEAEFNKSVEHHCQAKSNRPKKIQGLKNKVFAQVKVFERRQRGVQQCDIIHLQEANIEDDSFSTCDFIILPAFLFLLVRSPRKISEPFWGFNNGGKNKKTRKEEKFPLAPMGVLAPL
jgi:hypothetical protein